jgi:hypothetical protein
MSIIAVMAVPSDVYQGSLTPGRLAAKDDNSQSVGVRNIFRVFSRRDAGALNFIAG